MAFPLTSVIQSEGSAVGLALTTVIQSQGRAVALPLGIIAAILRNVSLKADLCQEKNGRVIRICLTEVSKKK